MSAFAFVRTLTVAVASCAAVAAAAPSTMPQLLSTDNAAGVPGATIESGAAYVPGLVSSTPPVITSAAQDSLVDQGNPDAAAFGVAAAAGAAKRGCSTVYAKCVTQARGMHYNDQAAADQAVGQCQADYGVCMKVCTGAFQQCINNAQQQDDVQDAAGQCNNAYASCSSR